MKRKSFIAQSGILLAGMPVQRLGWEKPSLQPLHYSEIKPSGKGVDAYKDETFWNSIRNLFDVPQKWINLENGYFSPQPVSTRLYHQNREAEINRNTSWFMRVEQQPLIEETRSRLALFLGCDPEELAITRNTTESLNTVIAGYPWKKGDEVVVGNQDYGSMIAAFEQQVKRHGIVLRTAQIPLHPANDQELTDAYLSLVTAKTRLIHLTHLINLSGQILPARKIIDAAHAKGIEVVVDAAHSVAHLHTQPGILDADYLGASLHKWLCTPLGAGILMVKKQHISKIWPLLGDSDYPTDNIRKFQHQGTRPVQTILAINEAISFHEALGGSLKEARLRYLKASWADKVKDLKNVVLNTPVNDPERSCAIANFAIKGMKPSELSSRLMKEYGIFTVAIEHPAIQGVRVTPHLYNTPGETEALVKAIQSLSGN